jgi:hypothetical protein
MREQLDILFWLLCGGELWLMGLMVFFYPQRQGWRIIPRNLRRKNLEPKKSC